jgi:putative FmdB family regulatory protein
MPTYRFYCDNCQSAFDNYLSFDEQTDTLICPKGHAKAGRLFKSPTIILKGHGRWNTKHHLHPKIERVDSRRGKT